MLGLLRVTSLPLGIFAHIQQDRVRVGSESGAQLLNSNFADTSANSVDDFQKTGRMVHVQKVAATRSWAKEFPMDGHSAQTGDLMITNCLASAGAILEPRQKSTLCGCLP